jgi:catechol 2,3-dioxygenase-like lactoylglutathione lyase family enzyme
MKRFHVHVAVDDLAANIRFYSTVFGQAPSVVQTDYAKWMLDDPRVNFAISARGAAPGLDHLGLQVDSDAELDVLRAQVTAADIAAVEQSGAACCYAASDKYWTTDPQGIAWETFHTLASIPTFGDAGRPEANGETAACCAPAPAAESCCAPAVAQVAETASCCAPAPVAKAEPAAASCCAPTSQPVTIARSRPEAVPSAVASSCCAPGGGKA